MKLNKKKRTALLGILVLLVGILAAVLLFMGRSSSKKEKIGFVMTGSIGEEGWNGMHYEGVSAACRNLGVELYVKENIIEFTGECGPAVEDLVKQGCKMIILSSYGYAEEVKDVIEKYPQISFYTNSFEYHADNVTWYFSRMYQARYLAGIVAGMKTENNKVGYVAAMPVSEVNRGINAFTLGVRRVNPDAVVTVAWSNSWDNEEEERKQADKLIKDVGVDVITYHQNQTYVADEADKSGVYSIGYHQSLINGSDKHLTAVVGNWQSTYEAIIKQYLRGNSADYKMYWVGMDENAVKLADFSDAVSDDIKSEVSKAIHEILSGKDVFSGVIYDNEGKLRCKENQAIRDEDLLKQFDWYVEGVEIYE